MSDIVATIERLLPRDPRLGDLVDVLGARASEILLAIIAIPAIIPAPGAPLGAVFGAVLTVIAWRMAVLGPEPPLPRWLSQVPLEAPVVTLLSRRGSALLLRVERRLRPRAGMLAAGPVRPLLALVVALMGGLIALPIPFGNTLPGLAVILMGLGLALGDGMAILGALILAAIATVTSAALGWAALAGLAHLLG